MRRYQLLLVVALAAGTLAGYLAWVAIRPPEPGTTADARVPEAAAVLVAARELPAGAVLDSTDLRALSWPAAEPPAGWLTSPRAALGRTLRRPLAKNEPLLAGDLRSGGTAAEFAGRVPPGMRAMAVRVDEAVGMAGFAVPGSRVDVLLTVDGAPGSSDSRTTVILEDVRVAETRETSEGDLLSRMRSAPVVALLVTPPQAQRLALAGRAGTLQLSLRNPDDAGEMGSSAVTLRELLGIPRFRSPAPVPVSTRGRTVEVFHGAERSTSTVPAGDRDRDSPEEGG